MRSLCLHAGGWVLVLGMASSGFTQTLKQRIDGVHQADVHQGIDGSMERLNIQARLHDIIDPVDISDATLRNALRWYSSTTGIPVVIDWRAMETEGIDPEKRITIQMRHISAGQLLGLMMKMAAPDDFPGSVTLMYETSPWYVQILTKRQADKNLIVRVYEVGDLLMEIPNFDNAPQFDLNAALSNTNSGGSNQDSGAGRSLFGDTPQAKEEVMSKTERGEALAQLIRDTVEPDVWVENGGLSTIRYHANRMIVSAPRYVHAKIGMPVILIDRDAHAVTSGGTPSSASRAVENSHTNRSGISGVQGITTSNVSSVGQ